MLGFGLACSWGTKSKIGICVYISVRSKYSQKLHVTLSTASFKPGYKQAFSMLLLGDTCKQLSFCQCPGDPSPHPSSLQTFRSVYGKGHPNSQNICFHNTEYSSEKHSPWSPLCLMVVSLSRRLPLSKAFCPTAPHEGFPSPRAAPHCTEPASLHLSGAAGCAGCLCLFSSPSRNLFEPQWSG